MPTGISLSAGVVVGQSKPLDAKYGPYTSTAAALADIPVSTRYKGLTVGIELNGKITEYWFQEGTADTNFIEKIGGAPPVTASVISKTYWELRNIRDNNQLVSGQFYKITDFQTAWWDFTCNNSQEMRSPVVEPLIVLAVTSNTFATIAYSELYPTDIIYYDFNDRFGAWARPGYGFAYLTYGYGFITRRIGIQYTGVYGEYKAGTVDANYDWRHITWSCRRPDLSTATQWSPNGTYSLGQLVVYKQKLFYSTRDNNTGRYGWSLGGMIDNPPDVLVDQFDASKTYNIGDEVWYTSPALNGTIRYYRKTGAGEVGVLPTVTATWTEESNLTDFSLIRRATDWRTGYGRNPFYWIPVTAYTEGITYFPAFEQIGYETDVFRVPLPGKMYTLLPNTEEYWSAWGSGGSSAKYSQFYGYPRLGFNMGIYGPNSVAFPWDQTTKAQKPTFAQNPITTDSTYYSGAGTGDIKITGYGNVFYGSCSNVTINGPHNNLLSVTNLTTGVGFQRNIVVGGNSKFGDSCYGNKISVWNCTFGNDIAGNVFGDTQNSIFGNTIMNNVMGLAIDCCIFDSQVLSNFMCGWFGNNSIGSQTIGNVFGYYSMNNIIGGAYNNNTITCSNAQFGRGIANCTGYIANSKVGHADFTNFGDFQLNTIESAHCCNFSHSNGNILGFCYYLDCGWDFLQNTMPYCWRVVAGSYFIGNDCSSRTFPFNNQDYDFTNSVWVKNWFSKSIFTNSAGAHKLSYYDASNNNQLVVVDAFA